MNIIVTRQPSQLASRYQSKVKLNVSKLKENQRMRRFLVVACSRSSMLSSS